MMQACRPSESDALKVKRTLHRLYRDLTLVRETGAGEGIRTLDPDLGKVVLYP